MTFTAQFRWWILALLLGLSPFHAFLITWGRSILPDAGWISLLSVWREVLIGVLLVSIVMEVAFGGGDKVDKKASLRLGLLDWLILLYIALSLIYIVFPAGERPLTQGLLGFRYDVVPFVLLFFVRRVQWGNIELLRKITLGTAVIVLAFGLLHALVLPRDFLTHFGYSTSIEEFRPEVGISGCQYVEATEKFCRAISTFGGPTRYGTYLLFIAGLLLSLMSKTSKWRTGAILLFALALINMGLTFSRSIWIGAGVAAVFAFFWLTPSKIKWKFIVGVFVAAVVALSSWWFLDSWRNAERTWPPPILKTIFVRETSTDTHFALLKKGWEAAVANPLGIGLGRAGPASVRYEKFLTENWYLQIAVEMGWLGMLLFLGILALISQELLRGERDLVKFGLFLSLLGIAVTGLFTHSFEETSTVLALFVFIGMNSFKRQ